MASSDSKPLPIYGVAHREYGCIISVTTGQVITGGLSSLAVTGSLDGGSFAATGLTIAEIGTTGFFSIDIDVTRMTCNALVLKVTEATANSADWVCVIYPSAYYLPATDATNKAVLIQDGTGTGMIDTASGKVRLATDGLNGCVPAVAEPVGAVTSTDQQIAQLYGAEFNLHTIVSGTESVYKRDSTTVMMTGTVTSSGANNATKGKMA